MKKLILVFILLLVSSPAFATSYFVDNSISGNSDSNACTLSSAPCATVNGAIGKMILGDTLYIGSHHAETLVVTTWAFPGTTANPNSIFSVDDTSWAAGHTPVSADLVNPSSAAFPTFSEGSSMAINGSFYMYGIKFSMTTTNTMTLASTNNNQTYDSCLFSFTSGTVEPGVTNSSYVKFLNPSFEWSVNTGKITSNLGQAVYQGSGLGPILNSSSVIPSNFMIIGGTGAQTFIGVDLSNVNTNIIQYSSANALVNIINSVKNIAATFSTGLVNGMSQSNQNVDSGATFYKYFNQQYTGQDITSTSVFRTGGMTYNGSNGLTYALTGNGNASLIYPLNLIPISIGHLTSGSSTTIKIHFVFDGANNAQGFNSTTLNNNQIWMNVGYEGSSSSPLASFASNKIADLLPTTSPSVQGTVDSSSWTTTGLTTPEKYIMSVTFTPQLSGNYIIWVKTNIGLSKTIWVDPQFDCTGNCS